MTPKILWPAQRQYRHNCGNDELIGGFDQDETIKIVCRLQAELQTARELLEECFINFEAWETAYPVYSPTDKFMDSLSSFLTPTNPSEDPPAMPEIEAMGELIDGFPVKITNEGSPR